MGDVRQTSHTSRHFFPELSHLCSGCIRDNDIDVKPDELGRDLDEALAAPLRPPILDRDGATLDPADFAQPLQQGSDPLALDRRSGWTQVSDGRHFRRLLRTAPIGHAAARPRSVMNVRRLIGTFRPPRAGS